MGVCEIFIPDAVSVEVSAAKGNYPDAAIAERMIKQDKIKVRQVTLPTDGVLDHYKLGTGEKEAIVLGVEMGEVDFITSDDRLAYIVMRRMRLKSMLLLDLLLELRGLLSLRAKRSNLNLFRV